MENVTTEKRNGLKIEIWQDQDPKGPDDWEDDGAFIVFYHRDFDVRRDKVITKEDLINYFYHSEKIDQSKEYHIFPLSALIHSGVCLYMGSHDHPADCGGWDSSFAGAVLCSKKEWPKRDAAETYARGLVKTWNDYLSGNVYGHTITDLAGELIESCGGYFGDYDGEYGALMEARAIVDRITNSGKTDHTGQILFSFAPELVN